MPRWTVSINAADPVSFAAAQIESCVIEYVSRGTDSATLRAHPDTVWAYNDTVAIYLDGSRRFYGRVTTPVLDRAGGERLLTVPVLGVQDWLNRIGYRQRWAVLLGDELGDVPSSRVILHAAGPDTHLTADGQVAAIVNYAAARGAPLAFGSSALGITLPFHEDRDLSCRQALEIVLRLTPSVAEWVDYSQTVPTLHYGEGSAFAAARVEQDSVCWRHDLVVPGLTIEVERINEYNGNQYRTIETLTAGDTSSLDAVFVTLPMAGREKSNTTRRLDVETEAVGDIYSAAWWKEKHPRLSQIAVADITIAEAGRAAGSADFPRIASVPLPDLEAAGITAKLETFWAVADVVQRDGSGEIISEESNLNLEMQFVTTDAVTKTYRWRDGLSVTTAEPTPSGLAAALLAHWSVLYAQGTFSCAVDDGLPHPGQTVLGSPVQTVRVDVMTNTVTGTFGPPSRLSAQDFVSFLNQLRNHRQSIRFSSRFDASPPDEDESDQTLFAPVSSSEWSPGEPARIVIAAGGKRIDLHPSDLKRGETAKFMTVTFKDTSGADKTVKVLATADMAIGGGSGLPTGTADHMILRWNATNSAWEQIGGYDEVEVILYTRDSVLNGTILFKPAAEGGVTGYASSQDRLLLQVVEQSTETVLILDHGHLADGGT